MRAKQRGRLVYTQRPDAAIEPVIREVETELPEPRDVIHIDRAPAERTCPHGGIYLAGRAVCHTCAKTDQSKDDLLWLAIFAVCKQVARHSKVAWIMRVLSLETDDLMQTAVLEFVKPRNRQFILHAPNPTAAAVTIAKRAILKLAPDRSKSAPDVAVSQMNLTNTGTTARLDYLAAEENNSGSASAVDSNGSGKLGEVTHTMGGRLSGQEWQYWQEEAARRAPKVFPGIDLLWTDRNLRRLQVVIDEAKNRLPNHPVRHWMVITMRLGLDENIGDCTWEQIARATGSTDMVVRYAYRKGLNMMKEHIISCLAGDFCKILKTPQSTG